VTLELPWPSSSLSGHNTGHWRKKAGIVAQHRDWAKSATLAEGKPNIPAGDIQLIVAFYPPNRRGDRVNFPNRMKPYFDGIADDRFLPSYQFGEPVKHGKVVIGIEVAE
jgi:crossover junction endodeoxyribonuclease RusA